MACPPARRVAVKSGEMVQPLVKTTLPTERTIDGGRWHDACKETLDLLAMN